MQKLILIDGNAILHRAYHSMPPFKTSKGETTNAVYGFMRMLLELLRREKPQYLAVAWDRKAPTFRHEEFKEYKATRAAPPDDLYPQLPRVKELLDAMLIPSIEMDGYEADDVLGTLATQSEANQDLQTIILTGDKDSFQLVTDKTNVMMPVSGVTQVIIYTPAKVKEKMGVHPNQIIDYKALCGDSSDNIPGIPGIGPKNAQILLEKYGTFEEIYNHLDELTEGQKRKLTDGKESGVMSKRIATIITNAPFKLELEKLHTHKVDYQKLQALFSELEFHSLISRLADLEKLLEQPKAQQQSLF